MSELLLALFFPHTKLPYTFRTLQLCTYTLAFGPIHMVGYKEKIEVDYSPHATHAMIYNLHFNGANSLANEVCDSCCTISRLRPQMSY